MQTLDGQTDKVKYGVNVHLRVRKRKKNYKSRNFLIMRDHKKAKKNKFSPFRQIYRRTFDII